MAKFKILVAAITPEGCCWGGMPHRHIATRSMDRWPKPFRRRWRMATSICAVSAQTLGRSLIKLSWRRSYGCIAPAKARRIQGLSLPVLISGLSFQLPSTRLKLES